MNWGLPVVAAFAFSKTSKNLAEIVPVNLVNVPSVGLVASCSILTLSHRRHRIERDVVGIVEQDQIVETEVRGKSGCLL